MINILLQSLSRKHATIKADLDGLCTITDLGSSNGTWKGSFKLKPNLQYCIEKNNKEIKFGNVELEFSYNDTDQKENSTNKFVIPETPISTKSSKDVRFIPDSQNSPARVPNIPQSPLQDSLNSSSFLSPSQPMCKPKNSPILAKIPPKIEETIAETSMSTDDEEENIFEKETQVIDGNDSDIFEKETQVIGGNDPDIFDKETQVIGGNDSEIFDKETQVIGGNDGPSNISLNSEDEENIFDKETQVICKDRPLQEEEDIFEQETQPFDNDEIFNSETQVIDPGNMSSENPTDIFDKETQVIDKVDQSNISTEDENDIFDEETQVIDQDIISENKNSTSKDIFDKETQDISMMTTEDVNAISNMETQAMDMTEAENSIFDMETQPIVQENTTSVKNETYNHTKLFTQRMEIDDTLEQNRDDNIFEQPTQKIDIDDDTASNCSEDFLANEPNLDETKEMPKDKEEKADDNADTPLMVNDEDDSERNVNERDIADNNEDDRYVMLNYVSRNTQSPNTK